MPLWFLRNWGEADRAVRLSPENELLVVGGRLGIALGGSRLGYCRLPNDNRGGLSVVWGSFPLFPTR